MLDQLTSWTTFLQRARMSLASDLLRSRVWGRTNEHGLSYLVCWVGRDRPRIAARPRYDAQAAPAVLAKVSQEPIALSNVEWFPDPADP